MTMQLRAIEIKSPVSPLARHRLRLELGEPAARDLGEREPGRERQLAPAARALEQLALLSCLDKGCRFDRAEARPSVDPHADGVLAVRLLVDAALNTPPPPIRPNAHYHRTLLQLDQSRKDSAARHRDELLGMRGSHSFVLVRWWRGSGTLLAGVSKPHSAGWRRRAQAVSARARVRGLAAAVLVGMALVSGGAGAAGASRTAAADSVHGVILGPSDWQLRQAQPLAVSFVSEQRGFLATGDGRLMATRDGGGNWRRSGPLVRFLRLSFLSEREGFALTKAGALLHTSNGGRTWSRLHDFVASASRSPGPFGESLDFVDRARGFAALGGRIYRSLDGGRTWSPLPFRCGGSFFAFGGVAFVNAQRGYAICGSQAATDEQSKELFTTADGGSHWRLLTRTAKHGVGLPWIGFADGLAFPAAGVGYLSADRAGIYRTSDAGHSWRTVLFTDDTYAVEDASWIDAHSGFVLLFNSGLARTDNGGVHWRQLYPRPPGLPTGPVSFSSATEGVGAGTPGLLGSPGAIIATSDGGRTWSHRGVLPNAASQQLVRSTASTLWVVATSPTSTNGDVRLFRTVDRGGRWQLVKTLRDAHYASVSFPNATVGFLAAGNGPLYRSNDGGRSWSAVSRLGGVGALGFLTPQVGFALAGPSGMPASLISTRDGGISWHAAGPDVPDVRAISLATLGPLNAWVAESSCATGAPPCRGLLLRTGDAGRSWQEIRLPRVFGTGGLDFVTPKLGYANDPQRGLYRTSDGGRTWTFVRGADPHS
jgi:photosystem II stability/assembly factor-like uncharacterized protein